MQWDGIALQSQLEEVPVDFVKLLLRGDHSNCILV